MDVRVPSCTASLRRLVAAACAALGALAVGTTTGAQQQAQAPIGGTNVNIVSGTSFPDGDPFLQRQNEPSSAASTRNPLHLLAGANDYRTRRSPGHARSAERLRGQRRCVARSLQVVRRRADVAEHAGAWVSAGHVRDRARRPPSRASGRDGPGRPRRHQRLVLLRRRRVRSRRAQAELDLRRAFHRLEQPRERRSDRLCRHETGRLQRELARARQDRAGRRHSAHERHLHAAGAPGRRNDA